MQHHEKIVLLPSFRQTLEEQGLNALKNKDYQDALNAFNKLIAHRVVNHEVIMSKIICLVELDELEEAQSFCEYILNNKREPYDEYLHIYLTITFQMGEYELIIDKIAEELAGRSIPTSFKNQYRQLYEMSILMKEEIDRKETEEYIRELKKAFDKTDYVKQWNFISKLRQLKSSKVNKFTDYLAKVEVHPAIKTAIILWLKDMGSSHVVTVYKNGLTTDVIPKKLVTIENDPSFYKIKEGISYMEQENPTLYDLLTKLLYRYFYVNYPLDLTEEAIKYLPITINELAKQIETNQPTNHDDEKINQYIKELKNCEALYLSVIED